MKELYLGEGLIQAQRSQAQRRRVAPVYVAGCDRLWRASEDVAQRRYLRQGQRVGQEGIAGGKASLHLSGGGALAGFQDRPIELCHLTAKASALGLLNREKVLEIGVLGPQPGDFLLGHPPAGLQCQDGGRDLIRALLGEATAIVGGLAVIRPSALLGI